MKNYINFSFLTFLMVVSPLQAQLKPKPIKILAQVPDKNQTASVQFYPADFTIFDGFDNWRYPRWMPIRLGKTNKTRASVPDNTYAKSIKFICSSPSLAKLFSLQEKELEPINGGNFIVNARGLSKGHASILAKIPKKGQIGHMDISVLPPKELRCNFYFVYDSAGHHPSATISDVAGIINSVNRIWGPQANVILKKGSSRNLNFTTNMSKYFDPDDADTVKARIDSTGDVADKYIVLTWRQDLTLGDGITNDALGFDPSYGNYFYVGVHSFFSNGDVVAHELGHSFGLPHQPKDAKTLADLTLQERVDYSDMLMFPIISSPKRLRHDEILAANAP